jgi:predicted Zn-dependent peptidase
VHDLVIEHLESPTLREEVFRVRLPSGLRVSFCPRLGFQKKYACYSTHFGSVDNELAVDGGRIVRVPDGIAHFLEHTLFETPEGNASDLFARYGASNNAYTSFTQTTYLFATSERFYENLALLIDFVEVPCFLEDRVEKERGIIEQEILGYEDSPDWVSYRGLLEGLFREHPVRIDIAGTVDSIRRIDVCTLQDCYDRFYQPSNMHLFVAGDLDRDDLFEFLAARSRSRGGAGESIARRYPGEPAAVAREEARIEMDVAMPKLLVGYKEVGVPSSGKEFFLRELVSQLGLELVFGRSSDAFLELYTDQLILDDFSASYDAGAGIGYAMVGGDTPRPDELKRRIHQKADEVRSRGLRDEDFERGKRNFVGGFLRGFNSLEYIANNYTYYLFHDFDLFAASDLLREVTREIVEARLRELLAPESSAAFVVLPRQRA